ncbi:ATP-grasp domain-containing protein [Micromonospora sp. FIMYZ51]|uniref:ATP-grasp domain-containing protein n=1 Tax=Micromonospora sp. FIMYZ51 TaxID=3051832 RepID=UPI0031201028
MKELLLIGAGYMGTPYLAAARRLGVRVTVVESALHRDRLAAQADRFILTEGTAEEDWAAAANAAAYSCEPDGVLGFAEPQVIAAALVQDALDVPGPSLHAAVISRNKALQRGCFATAGLCQPKYLIVPDVDTGVRWARNRYPVIAKPLHSSGSAGVVQVVDEPTLVDLLRTRLPQEAVLLEEFLVGAEYSWEALVRDGEVIFANVTAKETTGPPDFVELAHVGGVRLSGADMFTIGSLGHGVVAAMRVQTGIVHLEFRMTAAGPAIVEVAVRTPGDYIMDVIALTHGFDPYAALVAMALDLPIGLPSAATPGAHGASWFPQFPAGRVARVNGVDALRAQPWVADVKLKLRAGETIAPYSSSAQRMGHVLFQAPDLTELTSAMELARRTLTVDLVGEARPIAPAVETHSA